MATSLGNMEFNLHISRNLIARLFQSIQLQPCIWVCGYTSKENATYYLQVLHRPENVICVKGRPNVFCLVNSCQTHACVLDVDQMLAGLV